MKIKVANMHTIKLHILGVAVLTVMVLAGGQNLHAQPPDNEFDEPPPGYGEGAPECTNERTVDCTGGDGEYIDPFGDIWMFGMHWGNIDAWHADYSFWDTAVDAIKRWFGGFRAGFDDCVISVGLISVDRCNDWCIEAGIGGAWVGNCRGSGEIDLDLELDRDEGDEDTENDDDDDKGGGGKKK